MELNQQQREAVDETPKDITVSAAAGSGKTQVLGKRVLRRISEEDGVDVNRLLILTFTNSAAAEMRSRISRAVSDALKTETDPDKKRRLTRQLSLVGGADICTIDSFCYRLLKQNFFRVPGLASDFSIGGDSSVKLVLMDAMRAMIEEFSAALEQSRGGELLPVYAIQADRFFSRYDKETAADILEGFGILCGSYGNASRSADFVDDAKDYTEYVRFLKRQAEYTPDPQQWLDSCIRDYSPCITFDDSRFGRYAIEQAGKILDDIYKKLEDEYRFGNLNSSNAAAFAEAMERLRAIPRPHTYAQAVEIFAGGMPITKAIKAKSTKKEPGNPHAQAVKANIKDLWEGARKALYAENPANMETFRTEIRPVVLALCEMARRLIELETQMLMEKKKLNFSTCTALTLKLLINPDHTPSDLAMELRSYYDEIYVDEAQDLDPRQVAIFDAISNGRLFMVGDVKQSIYNFRHAEPDIFNSRMGEGESSKLITMNINYRSDDTIIKAVNQVFGRLMNKSTMNVDYENDHKMTVGKKDDGRKPCRCEFIAISDNLSSPLTYKFDLEAQATANRIRELIESKIQVFDKDAESLRPIRFKDIIVLFRTNSEGRALERIFNQNGIPCFCEDGDVLFSQQEIAAVTDVLTLLDNPMRDYPLAGMLRGLMFDFSENDLLKIRSVSSDCSFAEAFAALSSEQDKNHSSFGAKLGDSDLLARCVNVGKLLEKWRFAAALKPISEVIGMILTDTDYYASVGALPSGSKRRANLDLLMDTARAFEASGNRGLYRFLEYIKEQEISGSSASPEAKTLSDSMDVVRIMTIHKSKGLEAPVVFLLCCPKRFTSKESGLVVNRKLGFSLDYQNERAGYSHTSPISRIIHFFNNRECYTEELRILYVAMTRARERLICTGYYPMKVSFENTHSFDGEVTQSDILFSLKSYAKLLGTSIFDEKIWKLTQLSPEDIPGPAPLSQISHSDEFGSAVTERLDELLSFTYKYKAAASIPAKVSVSVLKTDDGDPEAHPLSFVVAPEKLRKPSFVSGKEVLTGAEIGTAYHAIMLNLDLDRPPTPQINEMVGRGIISPRERMMVKDERIAALMESPLGLKMKAAKKLWREAPFMINVSSRDIEGFEDVPQESVAVQGIIDCFFEWENGIILVDYKTDSYTDPSEIVARYKKQLYYYAKAINQKFSDKKVQKYLYLFHKGDIIEVD